jgi:hypothetical protein
VLFLQEVMVKKQCISLALSFLFTIWISFPAATQTSRALLVAIDRYPTGSGWNDIHATNDIKLLLPILLQSGYKAENIIILKNEEATKSNIVNQLSQLYEIAEKGDYIYFHFSGHGQLMIDDNGDEPDGLDESLVPYDAMRRFQKGIYEGENHLRDDELEILLDNIRRKITDSGHLLVSLDSCHSGTGTRDGDDEYMRGTAYVFASNYYTIPDITFENVKWEHRKEENWAAITVLAACLPDEINFEFRVGQEYYGTLSYTLYKVLENKTGSMTNREFGERLGQTMQQLLSDRRRKQTLYFETTDEDRIFQIGR